jgi:hypothetical protein
MRSSINKHYLDRTLEKAKGLTQEQILALVEVLAKIATCHPSESNRECIEAADEALIAAGLFPAPWKKGDSE